MRLSTVTPKKSATFFRLSTLGDELPHPRIVAFPKPSSLSNLATLIPRSLQSFWILSRIKFSPPLNFFENAIDIS
nr:MAG TPA: hypothetical protein [Caudoviricetes sp.]